MTNTQKKAIAQLISAAQATVQSVNGSNAEATRIQHALDLKNLDEALGAVSRARILSLQ